MIIPRGIPFIDWFNSLFIDFPNDFIPNMYNEDEWKECGNQLITSPSFFEAGAPSTDTYSDRYKWAYDVYLAMLALD